MKKTEDDEEDLDKSVLMDEKPVDEKSKQLSYAMNLTLTLAFVVDIAALVATGSSNFLGSINQSSERIFTGSAQTAGFFKAVAESPLGKLCHKTLNFFGKPPVKRAVRICVAAISVVAAGSASAGVLPAIALGLTATACLVNSFREYNRASKMKSKVETLELTSELRKNVFERDLLLNEVGIKPESQAKLNEFLSPPEALKPLEERKPTLTERVVRKVFSKETADSMVANKYVMELPSTVFFNFLESAGSLLSGQFLGASSLLTIGTISENKSRTEHRELKLNIEKKIKEDLSSCGINEKTFKSKEEFQKALLKQKLLNEELKSKKESGKLTDAAIESAISAASEKFEQLQRDEKVAMEEKMANTNLFKKAYNKIKSTMKVKVIGASVGYLASWNPWAERYSPIVTLNKVERIRETLHESMKKTRAKFGAEEKEHEPHIDSSLKRVLERGKTHTILPVAPSIKEPKSRGRSGSA